MAIIVTDHGRVSVPSSWAWLNARKARYMNGAAGALVVPFTGQLLAGWITGAAAEVPDDRITPDPLAGGGPFDVRAAVGRPGDGIAGFRASHRQALRARGLSRGLEGGANRVTGYADIRAALYARRWPAPTSTTPASSW